MSKYERKAKRAKKESVKAPRCCGMHMFMNRYGLWQCRKCGRQKFDTGSSNTVNVSEPVESTVVTTNDPAPDTTTTESTVIDVEPKVVSTIEK